LAGVLIFTTSIAMGQAPQPAVNHKGLVKLKWQLACQSSTFANMDFATMVEMLHGMTIHHIELAPGQILSADHLVKIDPEMSDADLKAFLTVLKSSHLDVVSVGPVKLTDDAAADRKVFEWATALKAKNIVAPYEDGEDLPVIDGLANEYKVKVAFEPVKAMGPEMDFKGRSKQVGICLDTSVFGEASDADVRQSLQAMAGRVIEVHLTDVDSKGEPVPFGAGIVHGKAILQELTDEKFKGIFAVQVTTGDMGSRPGKFVDAVNAFSKIVTAVSGVQE